MSPVGLQIFIDTPKCVFEDRVNDTGWLKSLCTPDYYNAESYK